MSDNSHTASDVDQPLLGLITSFESTPMGGMDIGAVVQVAPGTNVVISRQGQPLAFLPSGEHVLDLRTITALAPAFELTPAGREALSGGSAVDSGA